MPSDRSAILATIVQKVGIPDPTHVPKVLVLDGCAFFAAGAMHALQLTAIMQRWYSGCFVTGRD